MVKKNILAYNIMDNSKELRNVISILERIVSNLAQTEGKRGEEKKVRVVYTRPIDNKRFILKFDDNEYKYVGRSQDDEIIKLEVKLDLPDKKDEKGNKIMDDKTGKPVKETDPRKAVGLVLSLEGEHRMKQGNKGEFGKTLKSDHKNPIELRFGHSYSTKSLRGDDEDILGNLQAIAFSNKEDNGVEGIHAGLVRMGARNADDTLRTVGQVKKWRIIPDDLMTYELTGVGIYPLIYYFGEGKANKASATMQALIGQAARKQLHSKTIGLKIMLIEAVEKQLGKDDAYMGMISIEADNVEKDTNPRKMRVSLYSKDKKGNTNHEILYWDEKERFYLNRENGKSFTADIVNRAFKDENGQLNLMEEKVGISDHFLKIIKENQEKYEEQYKKETEKGRDKTEYELPDFAPAKKLEQLFKYDKIPENKEDGSCSDELVGTTLLFENGTVVSFEAAAEPAKMMMRKRVSSKPQNSTRANLDRKSVV